MCVMFRVSRVVAIVSAVTREARDLREAGLRLVSCVDLRLSSPRVGNQYYRDVLPFGIVIVMIMNKSEFASYLSRSYLFEVCLIQS